MTLIEKMRERMAKANVNASAILDATGLGIISAGIGMITAPGGVIAAGISCIAFAWSIK